MNWENLQGQLKTFFSTAGAIAQTGFKPAWCLFEDEPLPNFGDPLILLDVLNFQEEAPLRTVTTVQESGLTSKEYSSLELITVQVKIESLNHTVGVKAINFAQKLRTAVWAAGPQAVLNEDLDEEPTNRIVLLNTISPIRIMKRVADGRSLSVFVFECQFRTEMHASDPVSGGVIEHVKITATNFPVTGETRVIEIDKPEED